MNPKKVLVVTVGLIFGFTLLWALTRPDSDSNAKRKITVAAAASLADVMKKLAEDFQQSTGIRVYLDLGSSGILRRKIEAGARLDVFLSAASRDMDMLERSGNLQTATRRNLLKNTLVCVVLKGSTLRITSAGDLLQEKIGRVAVGNPGYVPAGLYARQAFERFGLWRRLETRRVFCDDARAVLVHVENGTVQAGIVYLTDARISRKVQTAFTFAPTDHDPIVYPGAVLTGTKDAKAATRFLDFLATERAEKIFARFGFKVISRESK